MIELLLSWMPYGDPPDDDVAVRFGMSVAGLKSRTAGLVEGGFDVGIDPYDRTLLVRAANLLGVALQLPPAPVPDVSRPAALPLNCTSPAF